MEYEAVIGLEVHVQIKTATKIFSGCRAGFGAEPNTLVDPVTLGLPGSLPVMNKAALDGIVKAGLALGCRIAGVCKWDRKNYFYPDSPKNYQITQYDRPVCEGGEVEIELPGPTRAEMGEHRRIRLTRIHLEEDVGKLSHVEGGSLIDYNRAGTPLMEIVSEPDLRSPEEAYAYLVSLRQTMVYCGISECDMEKGQLRCDANISVRPEGHPEYGSKVELKNLNSITGVRNGIEHEIRRQTAILKKGGTIGQETRRWNADTGATEGMRLKEEAHDYRYFPEPDLMPAAIDDAWKERLRAEIPELPFDRQRLFQSEYGLPYSLTSVLVLERELCDFFQRAAEARPQQAQAVANWIANDLRRELSERGLALADGPLTPDHVVSLVDAVAEGVISSNIAKEVFVEMFRDGETAAQIIERKGLRQETDAGQIEAWCREAIAENPKPAADFQAGNEKAINALKGQVMKKSRGKANPQAVDDLLRRLLA